MAQVFCFSEVTAMTPRTICCLAVLSFAVSGLRADDTPKPVVPSIKIAPAIRGQEAPKEPEVVTTHEQIAAVKLEGSRGTLQTLCVNEKDEIVALVAAPRGYSAPQKNAISEIHVLSPDGKKLRDWKVEFHANSINVGPDGSVYVAGDGKIARFDRDGKLQKQAELPHIAKLLADKDGMRKKAEEQLKQQKENFAQMVKTYEDMKKKLEGKKEEDRTKLEKRQLEQYDLIIKSFDEQKKFYDGLSVESIIEQITGRLRVVNAVAINEKDVFIVCGESQGYGFAVWRMDHDFGEPKQVLTNVIGCCGQMDVQCCGSDILVAENTKKRFAKYTRDGKELGGWGKNGKETEPGCFAGCCNPMNVRCCSVNGDIFTAESEGIIKRFSAKGDPLGIVAMGKLTGGCKNTAIATSTDGERVYLCDQPGSRVIILAPKSAKPGKKAE
jgi:hypothetical protein